MHNKSLIYFALWLAHLIYLVIESVACQSKWSQDPGHVSGLTKFSTFCRECCQFFWLSNQWYTLVFVWDASIRIDNLCRRTSLLLISVYCFNDRYLWFKCCPVSLSRLCLCFGYNRKLASRGPVGIWLSDTLATVYGTPLSLLVFWRSRVPWLSFLLCEFSVCWRKWESSQAGFPESEEFRPMRDLLRWAWCTLSPKVGQLWG